MFQHTRPRIPAIPRSEKNRVVRILRVEYEEWMQRHGLRDHIHRAGDCFWLAMFAATWLKNYLAREIFGGREPDIKVSAGSMSWPRVRLPAMDDGKILTHFSYMFDANSPVTQARMAEGLLPEMHLWNVIPSRGEIIDLSTRNLKTQCERIGDMEWLNDEPPDYIWCRVEDLPKYVRYQPDRVAVEIGQSMANAIFPRR